jgi:hypothetical protein
MCFKVSLFHTSEPPVYQCIAAKALQLQELGLADVAISRKLGVSDKTVAKAIRWYGRLRPGAHGR